MNLVLTIEEQRVLGVLVEKEYTTPDQYPLTLNSLTNGCNQKSSRHPVLSLSHDETQRAVESLRTKRLLWRRTAASGSRTEKYEHNLSARFNLTKQQTALLTILLLRGAQTVGELRTRSTRIHAFENLNSVQETLEQLASHPEGPFVKELPREAGRKECRYIHLFGPLSEGEETENTQPAEANTIDTTSIDKPDSTATVTLESRVQFLEEELRRLQEEFQQFKKTFE